MQAAATAPAWCPAHHQHHREPPRVGLRGRPGGRPRAMPRRPSSAPPGPYGMALLLTTWQWLARQAQAPCTHALAANITSPHQPAYPVHASGSVLVSRPGSDLMSGEERAERGRLLRSVRAHLLPYQAPSVRGPQQRLWPGAPVVPAPGQSGPLGGGGSRGAFGKGPPGGHGGFTGVPSRCPGQGTAWGTRTVPR